MSTESSSSSSSTTSSSCPTPVPEASANSNQAGGAAPSGSASGPTVASNKRFEYLLQQTELFSHFVGDGKKAKSPLKVKTKDTKSAKER